MEYRAFNTDMGVRWSVILDTGLIFLNQLIIIGFDGAVHMSEEVRRAREAVPRSMVWSVATNAVLAYAIVICMLFTMGSVEDALNASFPIIEICQHATGSTQAATAMVCGLLVLGLSVTLASIASASRLTWAWARDGALPKWFSYVRTSRPASTPPTSENTSRTNFQNKD